MTKYLLLLISLSSCSSIVKNMEIATLEIADTLIEEEIKDIEK